jgi:hypothetical protein
MSSHVIQVVRFARRTNDGPAVCSCGWSGLASDYAEHKRLMAEAPRPRQRGPELSLRDTKKP